MSITDQIAEIEDKLRIGQELPYEIVGLKESHTLLISGLGRRFFEAQRYAEASDIFFLLTILDPENYFYWLNLGICEQNEKNYEAAVIAYYTAICIGHSKPDLYFFCAQCMYHLEEFKAANAFLEGMRESGGPTPSTQETWDAAEALSAMVLEKV